MHPGLCIILWEAGGAIPIPPGLYIPLPVSGIKMMCMAMLALKSMVIGRIVPIIMRRTNCCTRLSFPNKIKIVFSNFKRYSSILLRDHSVSSISIDLIQSSCFFVSSIILKFLLPLYYVQLRWYGYRHRLL